MKEFYEAIEKLNPNLESKSITVLSGSDFGEQAIFSEGEPVFLSKDEGFIKKNLEAVKAINDVGIVEIAGEKVYTELVGQQKRMVVCGAGHVAIAIIRLAKTIGMQVTVVDDRREFVENAKNAGADVGICDGFEEALDSIPGGKDVYFVIVTRGHRWDNNCLRSILKKTHAYIGMMGSKRRVAMVLEDMKEEGFDPELVDSVHTPIGLRIGAETPEEIAVSILAEVIEVKNKKKDFSYSDEILKAINGTRHSEPLPGRKIMAAIISRKGSAPRETGTKMLLLEDGSFVGTIGGGLFESKVLSAGKEMFAEAVPSPRMMEVGLNADRAADEGEVCGGELLVWMQEI